MEFESPPPPRSERPDSLSPEREAIFKVEIGGPLKPNHLLTTSAREAKLVLDRRCISYRISLCSPERSLGGTSFVPAEYRIEVMDPVDPSKPAAAPYVLFVCQTLREEKVPILKVAPETRDNEDS